MRANFSISKVLKQSWKALFPNFWVLAGLIIGYMIVSGLLTVFQSGEGAAQRFVFGIVNVSLGIAFALGYVQNCFQALDGDEPQFTAYGQQLKNFGKALGNYIIVAFFIFIYMFLAIAIAIFATGAYNNMQLQSHDLPTVLSALGSAIWVFLLLQIPLILLALRFMFYTMFIVDEGAGAGKALAKSWSLTRGHTLKLLLMTLIIIGIMIAGLLCLFVGIFIAIPLIYLMQCAVYKSLKQGEKTDEDV